MSLEKLAPVGGRATSGRDRWWLERFAEVCQDLPDRPRLRDERHQPDVTATVRALKWKLLPHPGHEFRPSNPRRVVRARLVMCVAAASGGVSVVPMPAGHVLSPLTDIPFCHAP